MRPNPAVPPSPDELRQAADPATGLPGENTDSEYVEDAEHWCGVYKELLTFKRELLDQAQRAIRTMSPDAADESTLDERMLHAQAERYAIRYEWWNRRISELRAAPRRAATG